ncbi:MAG: hypothetical protein EU547_07165 [Promethearchaeota archaeon]|nr:MAG: hypothetical protein EU547_07165 [Candidatus Lokiarchaeota archaeon]
MESEKEAEIYAHFIGIISTKRYPKYRQKWGDNLMLTILKRNCLNRDIEINLLRLYSRLISDQNNSHGKVFDELTPLEKEEVKKILKKIIE